MKRITLYWFFIRLNRNRPKSEEHGFERIYTDIFRKKEYTEARPRIVCSP